MTLYMKTAEPAKPPPAPKLLSYEQLTIENERLNGYIVLLEAENHRLAEVAEGSLKIITNKWLEEHGLKAVRRTGAV